MNYKYFSNLNENENRYRNEYEDDYKTYMYTSKFAFILIWKKLNITYIILGLNQYENSSSKWKSSNNS